MLIIHDQSRIESDLSEYIDNEKHLPLDKGVLDAKVTQYKKQQTVIAMQIIGTTKLNNVTCNWYTEIYVNPIRKWGNVFELRKQRRFGWRAIENVLVERFIQT